MQAALALNAGAAVAAPGSAPQHIFMEAVSSPDGRHVVSVEGDASPSGGSPLQRDLVIRSMDGKTTTVVNLPCGRVAQCWPAAPAWTPDSRKVSFALRTPGSHARSLYQVSADGGQVRQLAAFDGTIADLHYGGHGELAMLATAGATKELSAVEAGAPVTGDLDEAPPEQRIAILEDGKLRFVSPRNSLSMNMTGGLTATASSAPQPPATAIRIGGWRSCMRLTARVASRASSTRRRARNSNWRCRSFRATASASPSSPES